MTVKTHDSDGNYSGSDEKKIRRSPRLRLSDEEDEGYNSSSDNNSGGNSGGNNSSNSNSNRYSYSSGSGGASRSMSKRRKHNQTNGEEASSKASLNMDDGKHMVRSSSNSSLNTATNRGNKNKKKPRMKLVEFRTDGTSYQPRRVAHNILKVRPVAKPQNMIQWDIPPATILIIKKVGIYVHMPCM